MTAIHFDEDVRNFIKENLKFYVHVNDQRESTELTFVLKLDGEDISIQTIKIDKNF